MSDTPERYDYIREEEKSLGIYVDPSLEFHDLGCVKRYGAVGESGETCACEKRRPAKAYWLLGAS